MPKIIKKKAVQKKPVQEEEISGFALEVLNALKKKQKMLITVGIVVAAMLALYLTFFMYSSSLKDEAAVIEKNANNYYYGEVTKLSISDEERLQKALELYKESVDIKVIPTALFNLGNTYYRLGDYANAIKEYDLFVDEFSGNEELTALVYQKLAASYVRVGQNDKAFGVLGKLAKVKDGLFKDTALVLEARYLENAGEAEKSLAKYRELMAEFPDSVWSAEAVSKLPTPKAADEKKV
ncbi:MAG TPA: tetratricopeptide repeat protein, partial [Nitrospirae bacterium]|nr:tetratricopeptide repeat protein [Nitrospirota bacterium]